MTTLADSTKRLGWAWYAASILSFVPLLGAIWGLVCVVYGYVQRRRGGLVIAAVGLAGFLFTVGLYGYLFVQLSHPTGTLAEAQKGLLRQHTLPDLVRRLEYYKLQNGRYPQRLEDMGREVVSLLALHPKGSFGKIHYDLSADGRTYHLFAVGPDGEPFTSDDIPPDIGPAEAAKTGWRDSTVTR